MVSVRNKKNHLSVIIKYFLLYRALNQIAFICRYLNTTFIKKQKYTEADLSYGNFAVELTDQMLEIGEVN